MIRKLVVVLVFAAVVAVFLPAPVMAYEAWGWEIIREDLIDGDGVEFIKPIPGLGPNAFTGATEMEAVKIAADWVAYHMQWVADPYPPGDVWTSSDQQYAEITPGVAGSGTGDCEDFSILLCALLRFHTQGGIPARRVWVQAGLIVVPEEEKPPVFGHAVVVYKAEKRGIFYIEPQLGGLPYRGAFPSIFHWYTVPPAYFAGESATLRFNDERVKGGGFWLAGPRN